MSYFDQINNWTNNIEQTQNALNSEKNSYASQAIGDLQDKYALIKQKALEGVPDIAGDVLNYTTQGVQALSGTYSTIRALRQSKIAKKLSQATGDKPPESSVDVDDLGLPKLSPEMRELNERLNKLRGDSTIGDPDTRVDENLTGGTYEDLAKGVAKDNIGPQSTKDALAKLKARDDFEPTPESRPVQQAGPAEPLVAKEIDPVTGQEIKPPELNLPKDLSDAEREIGVDGFTPQEREAIQTSNDPAKLERSLAEERAIDNTPLPKNVPADAPFEKLFPKAPQPLSATEKAAEFAKTTEQGGAPSGSSLLAKVTQQSSNDKPVLNPESAGSSAVDEVSAASKLASAADVAEGPLALAGMISGDIKGKGAQTTSKVINDGVGVKQGYNLGRRGKNLYDRRVAGEVDDATSNPGNPVQQSQVDRVFDVDPEDVSRPSLFESATEETPGSEKPTFEQTDFRINIQPDPEEEEGGITGGDEPPKPQSDVIEGDEGPIEGGGISGGDDAPKSQIDPGIGGDEGPIQGGGISGGDDEKPSDDPKPSDVSEDPVVDQPQPDPTSSSASDAISNVVDDDAENVGKSLGERILGTLGADSASEAALDVLGPIGEVAGLGLMLGGIFHDVFGKKKQEERQQQQEDQAQQQEQAAEQNLKTAQSAIGSTSGGIDLASLHSIAGADASVGIV